MKRKHIITVEISAEGKTDFGIRFLHSCLKATITALDGFKKCYSVKIIDCQPAMPPEIINEAAPISQEAWDKLK